MEEGIKKSIIWGIILALIPIIIMLITPSNISYESILGLINILIFFGESSNNYWIILCYFIVGAILGYIYNKFKSKNQ